MIIQFLVLFFLIKIKGDFIFEAKQETMKNMKRIKLNVQTTFNI